MVIAAVYLQPSGAGIVWQVGKWAVEVEVRGGYPILITESGYLLNYLTLQAEQEPEES